MSLATIRAARMLAAAVCASCLSLLSACGAETALTSTQSDVTAPIAQAPVEETDAPTDPSEAPAEEAVPEESAVEPEAAPDEPPVAEAPVDPAPETVEQSLYRTMAPSQNFDLSKWYLTLPSAATVSPVDLNSGYQYSDVFFTDPATGGMVFRCPNIGRTTANSSYSRTELRELLAPHDNNYKSNANNWTSAMGGTLKATVRIDKVSTTGESKKVGRVVIGQIHGPDATEVLRLYYVKRPGDAAGRIYAAYETPSGSTSYSPDIIANTGTSGIRLGEKFRYEVRLKDRTLRVVIRRLDATGAYVVAGSTTKTIDAAWLGKNLYFKAGVYNQNNTGDMADYVQATFFALTHTHP